MGNRARRVAAGASGLEQGIAVNRRLTKMCIALLAAPVAALSMAVPAQAAPAAQPSTITVPLSVVTPDGAGAPVTLNCGSAQLVVTASNHQYLLILKSVLGTITGGTYTVTTNGLGDVPVVGFVKVNGTATSTTPGSIPVPGVLIGSAFAGGGVETSQGVTCVFAVSAPWN
jgi:hypothetical protein